ncbi:MAG: hypothetical protein HN737_09300 [Desulfobacterales bacterium]|nr:hypothetical protein [Desulfobacteraceae bacterium]MBT7085127.1 hypothetical protein [Desulfobacterales bacterium]MBT7697592.1 hypothetical protein [Desulfobacterales bacterium]
MRATLLISVLLISIAINAAVFQHHYFTREHILAKNHARVILEENKKSEPYLFQYAGKEKWSNVFAIYRFNKETGEALRYSYTIFEEDKDGTPEYDFVEVLNMETGESKSAVSSKDRALMKMYFEKALSKIGKKKHKKAD